MDTEDIKAMPVEEIVDEDAILWLWTTNAHLRVAFDVVEAWGVEYRTLPHLGQRSYGHRRVAAWADRALPACGAGPPVGTQTTVLEAARREHSRKPEEFDALVEMVCPGRRMELFTRQQHEGWQVYGNDAGKFLNAGTSM